MSTNLLLILGSTRSGSTVLERFLARSSGTLAAGEVYQVWIRGRLENWPCTCGVLFRSCPLWTEVMESVDRQLGGPGEVERIGRDLVRDLKNHRFPLSVHHAWSRSDRASERLSEEQQLMTLLYREMAARSGAALILDSSKNAAYGHLLSTVAGVRVAYVVLLRDSRAVANSWHRVKPIARGDGLVGEMHRMSYRVSMRDYLRQYVVASELLPYAAPRMIAVTYEEFVRCPDATIARINDLLTRLGMPVLGEPDPVGLTNRYHSISGNPARFDVGAPLVEDTGWRIELPSGERRAVTTVTAPVLLAHHLLLWHRTGRLAPRR